MSLFGELGRPDGMDQAVRTRLADSLAHIAERASGRLGLGDDQIAEAVQRVRTDRQLPGVCARYYELIFAIGANQIPTAATLMQEIVELSRQPAELGIVAYAPEALGSDYDRFPRLLFAEYSDSNPMGSLSPDEAAGFIEATEQALDIVSRVDPAIGVEISELLSRVILAKRSTDPNTRGFGGVTSFLVWGASFANTDHYRTRWDLVQFLVHEITHALLFGLSLDEPLVRNSAEATYKSPLRPDPRPMDGIYHAALVCARLADFNRAWLATGTVPPEERERTEATVEDNLSRFRDGMAVIDEHGDLSARGRALVDRANDELLALS